MSHGTQEQYDIRRAPQGGWEVFDVATSYNVVIEGVEQTGLDVQDADALAETLAMIARRAAASDMAVRH